MSSRAPARAFAILLLFLSACAVQLAPAYDKQIVEGLQSTSEAALVQFAAVSDGSDASAFAAMEPQYNQLIGKLETLKILSQSRYVPAFPTKGLFHRFDPDANVKASEGNEAPSTAALQGMVDTLAALRDKHKSAGLTKTYVQASKGQFEIYLDQALTYEKALER